MFGPDILARMEELHDLTGCRIDAGEVRPLVTIAESTGEGAVVHFATTAMLAGNDVINVKGNFRKRFGEMTVFAAVPGAGANCPLKRRLHRGAQADAGFSERKAGLGFQKLQRAPHIEVIIQLPFLAGLQRAGVGFL